MTTLLVSKQFIAGYGDECESIAKQAGKRVEFVTLPEKDGEWLPQSDCDRFECAFFDLHMRYSRQLYAALGKAVVASKSLKWIHCLSSGVGDHPFVQALARKQVIVTNSAGVQAEPVAQTGFAGLLMLARGFPGYIEGQRRHEWKPVRGDAWPDDIRGQTLLLIGVGAIGKIFTRYARAFGLKVVGVRRSARRPDDEVDEMHPPSRLPELLPHADWIVIACPLNSETRNMIDADAFRRMRRGARLINVARGEIVDEAAMIEALRSGRLAGAALDAFSKEPLAADSPLWDLPNVVISPHNGSVSAGNEKRWAALFVANLGRWMRGEPLDGVQDLQKLT